MSSKQIDEKSRGRVVAAAHAHKTDHLPELPRLNRIRGQIDGIEKMIQNGRYCIEILQQIKAARSAMLALEGAVLRRHLEHCVQNALNSKNTFESAKKIEEIIDLINR